MPEVNVTTLEAVEARIEWLRTREFSSSGSGRGFDTQKRLVGEIADLLAAHREELGLPAADEPVFDDALINGPR